MHRLCCYVRRCRCAGRKESRISATVGVLATRDSQSTNMRMNNRVSLGSPLPMMTTFTLFGCVEPDMPGECDMPGKL